MNTPADGINIYGVLDLASAPELRTEVTALKPPVGETLFAKDMATKLLAVGPWLFDAARAPKLAERLEAEGAARNWGYFIHSRLDLMALRQHLRRFNLARLPDTPGEVLFRYYDPRVMGVFLDVATQEQYDKVFERAERIFCPPGAAKAGFDYAASNR